MINIKSLPIPTVLQNKTYENILSSNIDILKTIFTEKDVTWEPLEGDEYTLLLQAFSYRELYFREEINEIVKQLLLAFCSGSNLDHKVAENGVERIGGENPYTEYEFSISVPLGVDYTIQSGLVLTDDTGVYESILLEDVTINAGESSVIGKVELQQEIEESPVKTENITNSLPYVITATSLGAFKNGKAEESDESLLDRYLISFADKSTAGAEETYKSLTYKADSRIEDVKVLGNDQAEVKIYYFSESADALMNTRILETVNIDKQRPLTDTVTAIEATQVTFDVVATLYINENEETAAIQIAAQKALENGLKTIRKIGEKVTLSEINNFLKVEGVKEVVITSPSKY